MQRSYKKIIVAILTWQARVVLRKYKPKVVCITGSVGKTSTKDAMYVVLSQFFHVRKSEKSFNSETGIPLSILGVPNGWSNPIVWIKNILKGFWLIIYPHTYPKWLVLEVGADKPNDIKSVAKWINPYAVVMTRFPDVPVHIEFFDNKEHIIEEKSSLALALPKHGVLILNADDDVVLSLKDKVAASSLLYGFGEHAEIRASYFALAYDKDHEGHPSGVHFRLSLEGKEHEINMPHIISKNHVYAVLPALALALHEGCNVIDAISAVSKYQTPPGRLSLIDGIHGSTIIDDTYNASPAAVESALEVLKTVTTKGRKIAVLGDMLELGKYTTEAHKNIGKSAANACDILVTVGIRAEHIRESAFTYGIPKERLHHFKDAESAVAFLFNEVQEKDIVLVKGSQGLRLERVVKGLMADPKDAPKLLVRQEQEWLMKK